MSGKIKNILDYMINSRSAGDPIIAEVTKAKLILKGINPDNFDENSPDDPKIMKEILEMLNLLFEPLPVVNSHIRSAFTATKDEQAAAEEIRQQIGDMGAELLIFFASASYDQKILCHHLHSNFRNTVMIGCSTAGEISTGKLSKNSISAIAMDQKVVRSAKVEVVDLDNLESSCENAFSSFDRYFGQSTHLMDPRQYIGIILIDGLSMKEEILMDLIGNKTNILFVGASAGDDLLFSKTRVSVAPDSYENSAVLALIKISDQAKFTIIKTQSFRSLNKQLTANKVRLENRDVVEFNGMPALEAYAAAIGVPENTAHQYFSKNPVGLMIGDKDIFVRSPRSVSDKIIHFYCKITEGETVNLLESTDIIEDTRAALNDAVQKLGRIDGLINFNCILRTVELERLGTTEQYGNLFRDFPTAGFSTYGEEIIGHANQTATMIAFSLDDEPDKETLDHLENQYHKDSVTELKTENHLLRKEVDYLNKKLMHTIASLQEFNRQLEHEISERSKYARQVEYMSYHDILTGMFNRRYLNEIIEGMDSPNYFPITIAMGDVNGLKLINDSFGHISGDRLLVFAAEGIKSSCRENDIAVRWGGDEFVILMPQTTADEGVQMIRRITENYKTKFVENIPVEVAFGLATKPDSQETFEQILRIAEDRMYENKRLSRHMDHQ